MDLAFVVLIQLGALLWGIRAVHEQRPVAVVFLDSSFYTVPAAALTAQGIDLAVLEQFGDERPVYVYVERPTEGEAYERFARAVNEENVPPHEQAWLYRPATDHFATIVRASLDIREIMAANEDMKRDIEQLLASTETEIDDNYYITLTSRYRNIILVFDREGHLTGTINAPYHTGDV